MLFLTSCIVFPPIYNKVELAPAEIMPTVAQLKGGKVKVVVFDLDASNSAFLSGEQMASSIESLLEKDFLITYIDVIDPKKADELAQTIQLYELEGEPEYQESDIVDFAITGSVLTVSFSSKFIKASKWQNKKGVWHASASRCKYSAEISATLKIYKLPELSSPKIVYIKGRDRAHQETTNSNCSQTDELKEELIRQAASDGVDDIKYQLQNYFTPKAYVLEHRKGKKGSLFKLSRGKSSGFVIDADVVFYHLEESKNPLTGNTNIVSFPVAEGIVTNLIGVNHVWISVLDEEKASQIKLGDYVKMRYEDECFWCSINNSH